MELTVRQRDGVTIFEPRGRITIGGAEEALRDAVLEALDGNSKKLLINLEHVELIDSAGIGEMIAARTTTEGRGGSLKLLRLPPIVQDMLQIFHLMTIFDVFDDEEAAVASFAPPD